MTNEEVQKRAEAYVNREKDEVFRKEVEELLEKKDWDELGDRFYTDLAFGTGGLRGVIGGGFNRMNSLTVQRATQGLANYVLTEGRRGPEGIPSAVIAHDSRRYSEHFALQTALVFAANGIRAYLFPELRPTPELSFAVRFLKASTGIVITASHNPPEYNGYKVYWDDGAQIIPPHDSAIIDEVRQVKNDIKRTTKEKALKEEMLVYLDKGMDDRYLEAVKRAACRYDLLEKEGKTLSVVYSPLHGTGAMMVERVFRELGVSVTTVPEQREPDGEFPTVKFPNPEEEAALEMALALGKKKNADLVMATDPDGDRLGIAVPDGDEFRLITGNQLGTLLVDYILSARKELGTLPEEPAFVKTIVTTELQRRVAEHYGATVYDTLTGFKWIASVMRDLESEDGPTYVVGGEESYGYLIGTEVRDKDAVSAALLTAEMALYHVSQGKTVLDRLNEIYETFGYFEEKTISTYFRGQSGAKVMEEMMEGLRDNPPTALGGIAVDRFRDVRTGKTRKIPEGTPVDDIELPKSNVVQFFLADGTVVSARPSGTEPKIKFYISVPSDPGTPLEKSRPDVRDRLRRVEEDIQSWIPEE